MASNPLPLHKGGKKEGCKGKEGEVAVKGISTILRESGLKICLFIEESG